MIASFLGTNAFAVTGDRTAEFTPGVRVLADCGADGARYGTVAAALYAADADRTTVTLTLDADGLTASLAAVLHGNDIPASLANHGHTGQADGGLLGTVTPTANAHPIASALGRLTAWIDAATTSVTGIVKLATTAMCQAGTDTTTAVTPAGLASSAKGLITSNTTIYVATTGNDASGDGSLSSPFASIAQALASIKNKLIASGMTVTIQVVDGTYTISSSITIDHPDADKIQILGNTASETTAAIIAIETSTKSITVSGDMTAVSGVVGGGYIVLRGSPTGSAPGGNNGIYTIVSTTYDGTNTVFVVSETVQSATVGGSIIIKPCNKCVLNFVYGVTAFFVTKNLALIDGFCIKSAGGSSSGIVTSAKSNIVIGGKVILVSFLYGLYASDSTQSFRSTCFKNCAYALYAVFGSNILGQGGYYPVIDGSSSIAIIATKHSYCRYISANTVVANYGTLSSPDSGVVSSDGSAISMG